MRHPTLGQLRPLLCLGLCLHGALAGVLKREDEPTSTTTLAVRTTTGEKPVPTTATETTTRSTSVVATTTQPSSSLAVSTSVSAPSSTGGLNTTLFNNVTIPEGELPYEPALTPGWGVAGVILLVTGLVYALVGIRTQWVYTFFSAAYTTALGTTVLIVYVAPVPVSAGIQGALVVAAVCTGLLFGGVSVIFKDITECLGCLLGGFCFSMWLLTLQAGGLLPETGPKVALIAAFTLATFALYFSHWTRSYGRIVSGSFAGATAVVLGIDCFSRAGLKEFWAYVWALNDNLWPLGTVTYPLTKGIRVELAITIIVFLAGIVSQLRVWRLVQEHRAKRDALKAEEAQRKEDEENRIGKQMMAANGRELREWERVYNGGSATPSATGSGIDSVTGEKRVRDSMGSTLLLSPGLHDPEKGSGSQVMVAELPADVETQTETQTKPPPPPPKPSAAETVMSKGFNDSIVTVRVAQDDVPNGHVFDSVPGGLGNDSIPAPYVTPLPFQVPASTEEDDDERSENRSSVATFADETVPPHTVQNLAKRLSSNSAELLRRFSQHSKGSRGNAMEADGLPAVSREELMASRQSTRDDNDSIAAIHDDSSSIGDDQALREHDRQRSMEIVAQLRRFEAEHDHAASDKESVTTEKPPPAQQKAASKSTDTTSLADTPADGSGENSVAAPKSAASAESSAASLTKANLPRPLSRVAMSYRTNEWAKHLSVADTPLLDILAIDEHPEALQSSVSDTERTAPVNVAELQQTAENATIPLATPRSASVMSNYTAPRPDPRRSSTTPTLQNNPGLVSSLEPATRSNSGGSGPPLAHMNKAHWSKSGTLKRQTSLVQASPIVEEAGDETGYLSMIGSGRNPSNTTSVESSPTQVAFPASLSRASLHSPIPGVVSYQSPQTLLGQRESAMRNKSRTSFVLTSQDSYEAAPGTRPSGEYAGSLYNKSTPNLGQPIADADDMPMSQRREIIRQMSLNSMSYPMANASRSALPATTADSAAFNSHQPQRDSSHIKTMAAREAQLREFRNSISADLRAPPQQLSQHSLADIRGLREMEAPTREAAARLERERAAAMYEQRMRADASFQEAHREAMRRLQGAARDS